MAAPEQGRVAEVVHWPRKQELAVVRRRRSSAPRRWSRSSTRRSILFSKHGLYGVTLKDVAKRVGAHHTLLNYYFVDKKKLFDAVFARRAVVTSTRRMKALDHYDAATHGQAHGRRRAARLPRHRPRSLHPGRRELEELRRARRAGGQHAAMGRRAHGRAFRSGGAAADRAAEEGAAGLRGRRHFLGLSLRDRRADADARAHRPHRQTVRRPLPSRKTSRP